MTNTSKILIALGAGVVVGGVLGVLFAPDKGKITRQKIAGMPKELGEKIKGKMKIGKEKLDEVLNKVNDEVSEMV
jgi:gas vesicle protein